MKRIAFCLIAVCGQLHCLNDQKPPAYSEQEQLSAAQIVKNIPHDFFLSQLHADKADLLTRRAQQYFKGTTTVAVEPLMGYALLAIAVAKGHIPACINLAEQLLNDIRINQSVFSRNIAKLLLCHAVKNNHPDALQKLRALTHSRITMQEAMRVAADKDPADEVLLRLVCSNTLQQSPQDLHNAGQTFLYGNHQGRNADPLRALAVHCYNYHAFPESPLGPQALAEFMIANPQQHLFKNNKQLARDYATIAASRGLDEDTVQQLNEAIYGCVEPEEDSLGTSFWNWLSEVFG